MKSWATLMLIVGLLVMTGGCVTGDRLGAGTFLERNTPEGVQTPTGWVIRYYQGGAHQQAYKSLLAVCKDQKLRIEDQEYKSTDSELEVETLDGTEIEIQIWAPKGKAL